MSVAGKPAEGTLSGRPKPSERRRDPRFPITRSFLIKFGDVEKLRRTYVRDISKGGMFVRSRSPQPKGTRVRVVIGLPDGSRFPLEGEVVDVRERADGAGGNGIRFVDLDDTRLAMLESYIDSSAAGVPQPVISDDSDISLVNVIDRDAEQKLRSKVSGVAKRSPAAGPLRLGAPEPAPTDLLLRLDRALRQLEPLPSADAYEVLGLEPHAARADIEEVLARRLRELAHDVSDGQLPVRLVERLEAGRAKLELAAATLLDPKRRAVQDLDRGMLLPATEDPQVRQAFEKELETRRANASTAERAGYDLATPIVEMAGDKRREGDLRAARSLFRAALLHDPHNLQLREVAALVRAQLLETAPASLTPPPRSGPMPAAVPSPPSAPARSAPARSPRPPPPKAEAPVPPPPPAALAENPEDEPEPITMEVDPDPSDAISVADALEPSLAPAASVAAPAAASVSKPGRSRIGLIVGVGVLAAAAAVGILSVAGRGAEEPAGVVAAKNAVTEPAEATERPVDRAAPAEPPEVVEAAVEAEPSPAATPTADADPATETAPAEEMAPPPEPAPEPEPPSPFAEARRALDGGQFQRAYDLADAVGGKNNERFSIMTLAQCRLDEGPTARQLFRKLSGRELRSEIAAACAEVEVNVFAKGKGYTAGELLRKAEQARAAGNRQESCSLADRSNKKRSSAEAMEILGVCACEAGSKTRAEHFLKYLADANDVPIIEACKAAGIEL